MDFGAPMLLPLLSENLIVSLRWGQRKRKGYHSSEICQRRPHPPPNQARTTPHVPNGKPRRDRV